MSGLPSASASMRTISRASADTALRPRAVSAPAWAARPRSSIVRQTAPLRAPTMSPFSRPHSNTRAAAASSAWSHTAGARSRTSSSAQIRNRSCENGRGRVANASITIAASTSPPFMSATPGPKQRMPSRRNGRSATVPDGNTVSVWPSRATGRVPSPAISTTMLRPGPSGSSTHSQVQPSGSSQPATSSATRSCSRPPDGESMSTSDWRRRQKVSITRRTIQAPGPALRLWLPHRSTFSSTAK